MNFGFLRAILAYMVMFSHLVGPSIVGWYAVFGFYVLSGFLMTKVMHDKYAYTIRGKMAFLVNRFLRLFPAYWVAVVLSIILIFIFGEEISRAHNSSLYIPNGEEIVTNVFMLFVSWYPNTVEPRLVPPSWALTVELFFYILICFGLSKNYNRVIVWFVLSLMYVGYSYLHGYSFESRYFTFVAASLPFSIGSLIYFMDKKNKFSELRFFELFGPMFFIIVLFVSVVFFVVFRYLSIIENVDYGFYFCFIFMVFLISSIVSGREFFLVSDKIDKIFGALSYPMYLFHWQLALITSLLLYGGDEMSVIQKCFVLFVVTILVVLVSWGIYWCVDKPLEKIRFGVRKRVGSIVS